MKCGTDVLYFNFHADSERHRRKLAGIRRFANTHGWEVSTIPPEQSRQSSVRRLLARQSPVGCIVECSGIGKPPSPVAFGSIPVVWLDPPAPNAEPSVYCDNRAVAKAAFRELAAGLPPCCAVVPSLSLRRWSGERIDAFCALCAGAELPCHVFRGIPWEDHGKRVARLSAWIASLPRRSAVFAANDVAARDVAEAARSAHRHIPKELTLLGVDGTVREPTLWVPAPDVASIQLDFELSGFLAAKTLGDMVARKPCNSCTYGPLCVLRRESTRGSGRRETRILKAVDIIRAEACDGLTAAGLAARFPGSRKHFERRFREAMGHSILDEILHVRITKAKALLDSPSPSIGSIADFCGFGSERELRRRFSAETGMSMRQWRKNHSL